MLTKKDLREQDITVVLEAALLHRKAKELSEEIGFNASTISGVRTGRIVLKKRGEERLRSALYNFYVKNVLGENLAKAGDIEGIEAEEVWDFVKSYAIFKKKFGKIDFDALDDELPF